MSDKAQGNWHSLPIGSIGYTRAPDDSGSSIKTTSADTSIFTPPRDAYDLAEMIIREVLSKTWTAQAVADAIERLYEAREKSKI